MAFKAVNKVSTDLDKNVNLYIKQGCSPDDISFRHRWN